MTEPLLNLLDYEKDLGGSESEGYKYLTFCHTEGSIHRVIILCDKANSVKQLRLSPKFKYNLRLYNSFLVGKSRNSMKDAENLTFDFQKAAKDVPRLQNEIIETKHLLYFFMIVSQEEVFDLKSYLRGAKTTNIVKAEDLLILVYLFNYYLPELVQDVFVHYVNILYKAREQHYDKYPPSKDTFAFYNSFLLAERLGLQFPEQHIDSVAKILWYYPHAMHHFSPGVDIKGKVKGKDHNITNVEEAWMAGNLQELIKLEQEHLHMDVEVTDNVISVEKVLAKINSKFTAAQLQSCQSAARQAYYKEHNIYPSTQMIDVDGKPSLLPMYTRSDYNLLWNAIKRDIRRVEEVMEEDDESLDSDDEGWVEGDSDSDDDNSDEDSDE